MEDFNFILKFEYKGKPHIIEVRPWVQTYKIAFKVTVEEHEVTFEQDEEGRLRAISEVPHSSRSVDHGLIAFIAEKIEEALAE
ncbi:hypothetical protein SIO70_04195 [Chitinophaga sancti]|uniref:hypothetical protein n=1 Tax=Chitinophaga sancti TaxID=1004 RepID=UPI002A755E09|nr:hypothetical protein [Chitinophaga sancti]WPQ64062.1 hypothetical protein SIO70_04195 [Chitinophaga sancti]